MDTLTFITELIKSVAWPMTTIILVILLRKPIVNLLPLMKKLRYKEFELEFSQQVSELKAKAETTFKDGDENKNLDTQASDRLINLVSYSPRAAIMEAWIELETAAVDIVSSIWNQPKNDSRVKSYAVTGNLSSRLKSCPGNCPFIQKNGVSH